MHSAQKLVYIKYDIIKAPLEFHIILYGSNVKTLLLSLSS